MIGDLLMIKKLLLLPLLFTLVGCNINNNENVSADTIESSVIVSSSQDYSLICSYRIGSYDFENEVYLSWWIQRDDATLCVFNTFGTKNEEIFAIKLGDYTIITKGNDYSKGYLYEYSGNYYILEIGY